MVRPEWEQDEEYLDLVGDLLSSTVVQQLEQYTQHHYSNRLEHSINVSYRSFLLAKRLGGDIRATARAGLLHDLFFYDWRTVEKTQKGTHAYIHPRVALENARKLTPISEVEEDIIIKHMFGATIAPPKYKESYIVTMVDKYCACEEVIVPFFKKLTMKAKHYVQAKAM